MPHGSNGKFLRGKFSRDIPDKTSVCSNGKLSCEKFLYDVPREMPCITTGKFLHHIPNKMQSGSNGELLDDKFSCDVPDKTLCCLIGEFSREKFHVMLPGNAMCYNWHIFTSYSQKHAIWFKWETFT